MKIPKNTNKFVTNVTPSYKRNKAKKAIKKDPFPSPFICIKSVVSSVYCVIKLYFKQYALYSSSEISSETYCLLISTASIVSCAREYPP